MRVRATHQRLAGRVRRRQSPTGVVQEPYGPLLARDAVRVLMPAAARQAGRASDRPSFTRALALVREAIPEFQMTAVAHLPGQQARLLRDLVAKRLPARRPRANPRVVKRKRPKGKRRRPARRPGRTLAQPFHLALALIGTVLPLHPPLRWGTK